MDPYLGYGFPGDRYADPREERPPIPAADRDGVIGLVTADVVATLGAEYEWLVTSNVSHRSSFTDVGEYTRWLADVVQQDIHDEFIDTTWPACPRHQRHPLWYRDGAWWCEKDKVAVARLGELARQP